MNYERKFYEIVEEVVNTDDLNTTPILDQWKKNKKKIKDFLKGELILQKDIDIMIKDNDLVVKDMKEFQRDYKEISLIIHLLFLEEFRDNRIHRNIEILDKKFLKGTKVGKIFSYFVKDTNRLNEILLFYSLKLQRYKTKGIACLSIVPADFLTMSESKCGWTTCHSLKSDYQSGNLSLMTDSVTLVAYVKTTKLAEYNRDGMNFKWNNKMWRQLIHLNLESGTAYFNRQYPYESNELSQMFLEWVAELFSSYLNIDNIYTTTSDLSFISLFVNDKDSENPLHYNDLLKELRNKDREPATYLMLKMEGVTGDPRVYVGGKPICPVCGINEITTSEYLGCDDCIGFKCVCCGRNVIPQYERIYEGEYYCEKCYDDLFDYCDICGQEVGHDTTALNVKEYNPEINDAVYHEGEIYCNSCFESNNQDIMG